jgi:hypothetical protein
LKKNLIDQDQARNIDLKSDKRSFQAFAVIIIIESMSSKQENIKSTSKKTLDHEKADDFQISMKTSQHLTTELIIKLTPELSTELTSELTPELTPELNTELATALDHEMDPEIEISEPYETAANDDHSSSFITTVLKLRRYVE